MALECYVATRFVLQSIMCLASNILILLFLGLTFCETPSNH
jgi:hypothetical protein